MKHLKNLTLFTIIVSSFKTSTSQDQTCEEPGRKCPETNVPELPPRGIRHRSPPPPPTSQSAEEIEPQIVPRVQQPFLVNPIKRRLIYKNKCYNELRTQSFNERPYIMWVESSGDSDSPEVILQRQVLEEGDDYIPEIMTDYWCLHEGQIITNEDCNAQCKVVDKGKHVEQGLCMHNVCFCEWTTPEDTHLITYRTLEDSESYEEKLIKFIQESSLGSIDGSLLLDEEPQPSCSIASPWGTCLVQPVSSSKETCLHGQERIDPDECDRRCLEFGRTSGAKIKKGFCLDDQCRCKYYRFGICLSKKLKSLEKREHEETREQFVRLAQDLGESRIMLDTAHDFRCRNFNHYHRS